MNQNEFKNLKPSASDYVDQSYEEVTFDNCDFSNSNFTSTLFENCKFVDCNLSNVIIANSKFQQVSFERSKLVGLDFSSLSKILLSVGFINSNISFCNFSDLILKNTKFVDCQINTCDFMGSNLQNSSFENTSLADCQFQNCDLTSVDFTTASDFYFDPWKNKMDNAMFSVPGALNFLAPLKIIIE